MNRAFIALALAAAFLIAFPSMAAPPEREACGDDGGGGAIGVDSARRTD